MKTRFRQIVGSVKAALIIKDPEHYLPEGVTEIVSGGAKGIDACVKEYANSNGIKLTEFLPEYERYGRGAPFRLNMRIIDYADEVLAFWDGRSKGTKNVIEGCKKKKKSNGISGKERAGLEKGMTVPQKIKGRSFSAPAFAAPGMECRLFFTNVILMRFRQPVPKNSRRAFI